MLITKEMVRHHRAFGHRLGFDNVTFHLALKILRDRLRKRKKFKGEEEDLERWVREMDLERAKAS